MVRVVMVMCPGLPPLILVKIPTRGAAAPRRQKARVRKACKLRVLTMEKGRVKGGRMEGVPGKVIPIFVLHAGVRAEILTTTGPLAVHLGMLAMVQQFLGRGVGILGERIPEN